MGTFSAQVKDFAQRTKAAQVKVLHSSVDDVLEMAMQPGQSLARGAPFVTVGAVPVDTGHLINSVAADLNGSGQFQTDQVGPDWGLVIADMNAGDVAHFAWTAEYALATEVGHGTYPGAHWVATAAAHWEEIVAKNAERFKE